MLAGALAASGRAREAIAAADRALSMKPDDVELQSLAQRLQRGVAGEGWRAKFAKAIAALRGPRRI
jgi:hypothetical protein